MGRFYRFTVGGQTWSSQYNNKEDPGAPLLEMDITVAPQGEGDAQGSVVVWGIPLSLVSQQKQFWNQPFKLEGGMSPGLPRANAQAGAAGVLLSGRVTGTFSTWEGVTQNLGFMLGPGEKTGDGLGTIPPPPFANSNTTPSRNLVLNWKKGQPLSDPLKQALQSAFPGVKVNMNINSRIVAPQDSPHYAETLGGFATMIRSISKAVLGASVPAYPGVSIDFARGELNVFDSPSGTKAIKFTDLIGQPVWVGPNYMNVKMVMRGDLKLGMSITLPVNSAPNVAGGQTGVQQPVTFSGSWVIDTIRHVGNSRAPSGDAWCTVITCSNSQGAQQAGAGGQASSNSDGTVTAPPYGGSAGVKTGPVLT
jgi:hypothetical protein